MQSRIDFRNYLLIFLAIAIFTTPLGVLSIKGWAGYHLFICAFFSLILLWLGRSSSVYSEPSNQTYVRATFLTFALPLVATLLAQLLRKEFNLSALDSPARFILVIPILYSLLKLNINLTRLLVISIPLSVIATYFLIPYLPQKGWALDSNRLATYSVDPLTFGKIALGLGLMSALIAIEKIQDKLIFIVALSGTILGIYLSIQSQSRTGWLSIFFVTLFLIIHIFRSVKSVSKKIIVSLILSTCLLTPFLTNPQVLNRAHQAILEIKTWQPNKNSIDTSVGMRLSFWSIGTQLFLEKPITGWGNDGFKQRLAEPDFQEIASQYTRDFTLGAGFHSDIMQNAVRSGFLGLAAYLSIFLVPLTFFIRLYLKNRLSQLMSGLGIIYVLTELISSLSTEVLSLKSTASFYGLMVVFLLAGCLNTRSQPPR
jgi:O-antigen ligase